MENSIKIAVCDDVKTDREKIISLLSSYLDQNNLYAEIDEFESGEAFLQSDIVCYRLAFMDIFMGNLNGMETAKKIIQAEGGKFITTIDNNVFKAGILLSAENA